jgi:serine/threonine protein kinase
MAEQLKKYQRIKLLGKGSFGRAILVRDVAGAMYVMKEITISGMTAAEKNKVSSKHKLSGLLCSALRLLRAQAAQEAKVLRLLKHPNIGTSPSHRRGRDW